MKLATHAAAVIFFALLGAQVVSAAIPVAQLPNVQNLEALVKGLGIGPNIANSLKTVAALKASTALAGANAFKQQSAIMDKLISDIISAKSTIQGALKAEVASTAFTAVTQPLATISTKAQTVKKLVGPELQKLGAAYKGVAALAANSKFGIAKLAGDAANIAVLLKKAPAQVTQAFIKGAAVSAGYLQLSLNKLAPFFLANPKISAEIKALSLFLGAVQKGYTTLGLKLDQFKTLGGLSVQTAKNLVKGYFAPIMAAVSGPLASLKLFKSAIAGPPAAATLASAPTGR